jgi:hypothetical protein
MMAVGAESVMTVGHDERSRRRLAAGDGWDRSSPEFLVQPQVRGVVFDDEIEPPGSFVIAEMKGGNPTSKEFLSDGDQQSPEVVHLVDALKRALTLDDGL